VLLLLQQVLQLALLVLVHLLVVEGLLVNKLLVRLSAIALRVIHQRCIIVLTLGTHVEHGGNVAEGLVI
jgi:hypothetical protein